MRVIHDEAKSWDRSPFVEEQKRFVGLFRAQLTPRERALLAIQRVLLRTGLLPRHRRREPRLPASEAPLAFTRDEHRRTGRGRSL